MSNNENNFAKEMEKLLPKGLLENSPRTRRREESARRRSAVRRKAAANYEAAEAEQGSVIAAMFNREMDAGIFFDNEHARIEQVNDACAAGNMTTVKIRDSCSGYGKTIDNQAPANIINKATNLYYKLHVLAPAAHCHYDKVSGIRREHIEQLQAWEKATRNAEKRFAFFDWDRTLTMVEGVVLPPPVKIGDSIVQAFARYGVRGAGITEDQIYEDMSEYLAGGRERLQMIREMFIFLNAKKINVVLITNNGACVNPNQVKYYKELVFNFIGHNNIAFLCTKNTFNPNKPHAQTSDKGYAISVVKEYKKACKGETASAGGGRRNKTKKNRQRK
jgi:hypothetical protein